MQLSEYEIINMHMRQHKQIAGQKYLHSHVMNEISNRDTDTGPADEPVIYGPHLPDSSEISGREIESEPGTAGDDPVFFGPDLPDTLEGIFALGHKTVVFPPVFTHHTYSGKEDTERPHWARDIIGSLPYGPTAPVIITKEYYRDHLDNLSAWTRACFGRMILPEQYSAYHLAQLYDMYLHEIAPTSRLFLAGFAPGCAEFLQAVCSGRLSQTQLEDALAARAVGPYVDAARAELGDDASDEEIYEAIKLKIGEERDNMV